MIVFPVLIPGQNFLFPGTGREGKFEACIPGNPGKWEFPLTLGILLFNAALISQQISTTRHLATAFILTLSRVDEFELVGHL